MASSIESEFNPPDDLSRDEVIQMARHYINYWKIEAESWQYRWENINEWQPIETAPKDGRLILATNDFGGMVLCWWGKDYNDESYEGWLSGDGDGYSTGLYYSPLNPTHWMPLPKPPETTQNCVE